LFKLLFHLPRPEEKSPMVILGLDEPTHLVHAEFNAAGTHAAWGQDDGSVTACRIGEVQRRLVEPGLGW
jgi:hypothetical protein